MAERAGPYGRNLSAAVDALIAEARAGTARDPGTGTERGRHHRCGCRRPDARSRRRRRPGFVRGLARPAGRRQRGQSCRTGPRRPGSRRAAVADLPAAVVDTHALIFHAVGNGVLGKRAAAHFAASEAQQALTYVPMAVIWEVSLLARVSRVNLSGGRCVTSSGTSSATRPYQPYDLAPEQLYPADDLRFTRDPVRCADCGRCARTRRCSPRDAVIRESGAVRVVW